MPDLKRSQGHFTPRILLVIRLYIELVTLRFRLLAVSFGTSRCTYLAHTKSNRGNVLAVLLALTCHKLWNTVYTGPRYSGRLVFGVFVTSG